MPKRTFQFTAGTKPQQALDRNPKRVSYSIVNNGGAAVYTGADAGLTVDSGEPLPAGAMVSDDDDIDDVFVIAPVDGVNLRITEKLKEA